jgi:5'-phosphate synthase pdxT subunit
VFVRQGNVLGTSFHPELTADHRVHAYFTRMIATHDQAA